MADWSAFFKTEEFRAYRKKQVQAVADNIKKDVFQLSNYGKVDLETLRGKMDMIRLFLRLPETLTQDNELKDLLSVQMDEDIANITRYLIRHSLNE